MENSYSMRNSYNEWRLVPDPRRPRYLSLPARIARCRPPPLVLQAHRLMMGMNFKREKIMDRLDYSLFHCSIKTIKPCGIEQPFCNIILRMLKLESSRGSTNPIYKTQTPDRQPSTKQHKTFQLTPWEQYLP